MSELKKGNRVRILNLPDNVTDEVKTYEGCTGEITAYGSQSKSGEKGYYVKTDDGKYSKRFYESELRRIR